jgi:hypothetical protein
MKGTATYITILILAIGATSAIAHLGPIWLAAVCFPMAMLPLLSLVATVRAWQPWFLEGIEQEEPEPDFRLVCILTGIFEAGTVLLCLSSPWLALICRFCGMLVQLMLVGKYKRETTIDQHDEHAKNRVLHH